MKNFVFYPSKNISQAGARQSVSLLLLVCFVALLILNGCSGSASTPRTESRESALSDARKVSLPQSVPTWLGNYTRNFYGTGPWPTAPLEVLWSYKTKSTSGRLHKDPWGGTSWPGQPSVADGRVYFGSADSYLYCLNTSDGSLVWSFKTEDSLKATPTIVGDRIIASGLDHYLYCLNREDGKLIWKYKTGFEIDGAVTVFDGRVYFGGEDRNFYSLDLKDGSLVYKRENLGSMEGSSTVVDGRVYVGTEQGDLYCLNLADGATIWKTRIGADSDSTPAVANGFV